MVVPQRLSVYGQAWPTRASNTVTPEYGRRLEDSDIVLRRGHWGLRRGPGELSPSDHRLAVYVASPKIVASSPCLGPGGGPQNSIRLGPV